MSKVRIKLATIGDLSIDFQAQKILCWKSSVFEIVGAIDNYALRCDSDGEDWAFSDKLVKSQLPKKFDADFMIAIVNFPIQENWYSRRLGNNQVVFTFHQINEILDHVNIPMENVIYRLLYAYSLLYKRAGDKIPDFGEVSGFTHDETRGCLFDMNGIKTDLIASCDSPIICDECQERLKKERVPKFLIESTQKEIRRIRKDLYYRVLGFVRKYPIWSLAMSSLLALLIGMAGSLIASFIYDGIKANLKRQETINHSSVPAQTLTQTNESKREATNHIQ